MTGNELIEPLRKYYRSGLDSRVLTVLIIRILVELLKVRERDVPILLPVLSDVAITLTPPHGRSFVGVRRARMVSRSPSI